MNRLMQGIQRSALTLVVSALTTLVPGTALATTGVLDAVGSFKLSEDHYGMIWMHDYATLDCQGHFIYDDDQGAFCGQYFDQECGILAYDVTEVKIINCKVRNFDMGLYASDVSHLEMVSFDARHNDEGFHLLRVDNRFGGYIFKDGYYSFNNAEGADIDDSRGLLFIGNNRFRYNDGDGIDCQGSSIDLRTANAGQNLYNGVELDFCPLSKVTGSTMNGNGNNGALLIEDRRNGLSLDNSDSCTVSNNTLNDNYRDGIRVDDDSDSGSFTGNSASGNDEHDAHQTANSSNTWSNNTFGTTAGI